MGKHLPKAKKIEYHMCELQKVINHLKKGESVYVSGLGTFSITKIEARTMMHNTGKRKITTKPYNRIKFTATSIVREVINQ